MQLTRFTHTQSSRSSIGRDLWLHPDAAYDMQTGLYHACVVIHSTGMDNRVFTANVGHAKREDALQSANVAVTKLRQRIHVLVQSVTADELF